MSRQYNGRFAYRSAVTGEREFIKVEVSLREENLLPPEFLLARTLLRDPYSAQSALPPVNVRVLQRREAYSEKIRAALTRREPAIRDFFDIDHAVQGGLFDYRDPVLLDLLAAKLSVAGNEPVDLSEAKIAILREQVETQLRPVLRMRDYESFDLDRVILVLEDMVRLHQPSGIRSPWSFMNFAIRHPHHRTHRINGLSVNLENLLGSLPRFPNVALFCPSPSIPNRPGGWRRSRR